MSRPEDVRMTPRQSPGLRAGAKHHSAAQQPSVRRLAEAIVNGGEGQVSETVDDIAPALAIARLSLESKPPVVGLSSSETSGPSQQTPTVSSTAAVKNGSSKSDAEPPCQNPSDQPYPELRNTKVPSGGVDTTVRQRYAPSVTHETIIENVHEVREEQITRTTHHHDVFHRILPIVETEVLPARHFIKQNDGSLTEVASQNVPNRPSEDWREQVRESGSKTSSAIEQTIHEKRYSPRRFTARDLTGIEKEYSRTEQVWLHPPVLACSPEAVAVAAGSSCSRSEESSERDVDTEQQ